MDSRRIETANSEVTRVGAWLCIVLAMAISASWAAEPPKVDRDGGTIAGFVRIEGQVPKLAPLEVNKDTDFCKDVPNETLVIGPGNGVRYSVVTIEGAVKTAETSGGDRVSTVNRLDNKGCRFVPHVLAMEVNQFLEMDNSDPILHATHALFHQGQPQFNVGLYPGRIVRKPIVATGP